MFKPTTKYIVQKPVQSTYATIRIEMMKPIAGKQWLATYEKPSDHLLLFQTNWEVDNPPACLESWKTGRETTSLQVSVQFRIRARGAASMLTTNIDHAAPASHTSDVESVATALQEAIIDFLEAELVKPTN